VSTPAPGQRWLAALLEESAAFGVKDSLDRARFRQLGDLGRADIGVVTGANMFIRTLGSAVGIAVLGAIANSVLADRFRNPPADLVGRLPKAVDAASISFTRGRQSEEVLAYVRSALFDAVHYVFWALVAVALLGLVAAVLMPRRTEALEFDD
jgi:hypothetical protein